MPSGIKYRYLPYVRRITGTCLNYDSVETGLLLEYNGNTAVADAVVPYVAKPSATMI